MESSEEEVILDERGPQGNSWCPSKREMWTQTHREKVHKTIQAETGVTCLQAKECQGLPVVTRSWERSL